MATTAPAAIRTHAPRRRTAGRPRDPVPARSCAGRRPGAGVGVAASAGHGRGEQQARRARRREGQPDEPRTGRDVRRTTGSQDRVHDQPDDPDGDQHEPGGERDGRRQGRAASGRRRGRASPRRVRGSSARAGVRARRPSGGARPIRPAGRPSPGAWSIVETCSMSIRIEVAGRRALGHPVGQVGGGPDRFARHDDEAVVQGVGVDGDPLEALADLERPRLAAVLDRPPAVAVPDLRPGSGGARAGGGRGPRRCPRRRSGPRSGRSAPGRRPARSASATPTSGVDADEPADAIARAERAQQRRRRARATSRPASDGEQGDHGGDDSAGHERARRNLPDTWALMRSPPLVSLDPSGLVRTVRCAATPWQGDLSTSSAATLPVIHSVATPDGRPRSASVRPQFDDRPVAGSSAFSWPS